MLKKTALIILIGFAFSIFSIYAKEPLNLSFAKKAVETYYSSGEYQYDANQAVAPGMEYLATRIQQNHNKNKLALVFDIDDTLLLNYAAGKKLGFGGTYPDIMKSIQTETGVPILATQQLFNLAKRNHLAIFLITGRKIYMKKDTIRELQEAGYSGWTKIFFEPNNLRPKSTADFKTPVRQQLEQKGYDIVINTGDQYSDLKGGYADKTIKLPNPMYFVP